MKATTRNNISHLDNGEWLVRLLSDVRQDATARPTPVAVERIRARLLSSIYAQEKAAA